LPGATSGGKHGDALQIVSIADQLPLSKHTADVLPESVKPASHDTVATSPRTANCADTEPFAGACNASSKQPAATSGMHVGTATLHKCVGKQTATSVCDKKYPALQLK
jgi:hypothetical protein